MTTRATGLLAEIETRHEVLETFRHPWWLKGPHGSNLLIADFGAAGNFDISLNIELAGGARLTTNRTLVNEVYDYLCVQTRVSQRGRGRDSQSERRHFMKALSILDYFFLNDDDETL